MRHHIVYLFVSDTAPNAYKCQRALPPNGRLSLFQSREVFHTHKGGNWLPISLDDDIAPTVLNLRDERGEMRFGLSGTHMLCHHRSLLPQSDESL